MKFNTVLASKPFVMNLCYWPQSYYVELMLNPFELGMSIIQCRSILKVNEFGTINKC